MSPSRMTVRTAAALLLSVTSPLAAPAQNPERAPAEGEPVLPEIVITPSRAPRSIQSEPSTVYQFDGAARTVQEATRTAPDALKGVPSVMVQKTSYGQGSPFLRGFTGFRTVCLVDGIRLNNSVFRDGPNQYWNTVDPLSIRNYELVMGPGSVLYGSDAIGGVLNALTLEPPAYDGQAAYEPRLYYRGATAERSNTGRAQFGARVNEQLGFIGGVSLKDFGDLEGGRDVGRQKHTGYDEQDYDGRADWYPSENWRATVGYQNVNQNDVWRTHKTIYGIDWDGLTVGDEKVHTYDQHRDLTYVRLAGKELQGFADDVSVTLSRQVQREDLYRVKKDDKGERQGFDVDTLGATLQLGSSGKLGDWVYGVDYYYDDVSSYADKYKADGSFDKSEIQGPVADDASYSLTGVFAEDTLHCFGGLFDATPGVRYTHAQVDANKVKDPITGDAMSIDDEWDNVCGSLRLLVPLTQDRQHAVFASVAQGFRAPNLSDLTRLDTARSSEIETPSPDLDPEEYVACEVGVKSRFQNLVSQASAYYTDIDGMIVRTPTGRTIDENTEVTKKNSGKGYVQGVELSETWHITREWSVWASGSLMDGRVDTYPTSDAQKERDTISRLMPPTAQLGVRWQAEPGSYWAELVSDMAAKADKLSADDQRDTQRIPPGGTPGYAVLAARVGTRIAKRLDLAFSVENIFDKDYRIHGSGCNEAGRNFILTANATF